MIPKKHPKDFMILAFQWLALAFIGGFFTVSCVYDFVPATTEGKEGVLVIEGDILAGGHSGFRISTTQALSSADEPQYITRATIWVESESGEIFNAVYDGNMKGTFTVNTSDIHPDKKYRLCVEIPGRGSYRSSLVPVLQSPQIDSISYTTGAENEFVQMEINTHGKQPDQKYYKWLYYEDWEFKVNYIPSLRYNADRNTLDPIPGDELGSKYYCWEKDSSTGIHIASTEKLAQNIVYRHPLKTIYNTDRRISFLYSMLVSQIALTQEGYIYWETLKKNTDETGGIFAPQPSEMRGNLESITNPGEPVIGFISASTVTQKRIFVSHQQLRIYKDRTNCQSDTLSSSEWRLAAEGGSKEVIEDLPQRGKAVWVVARCTNCLKAGGTKKKPSFWPNEHQ